MSTHTSLPLHVLGSPGRFFAAIELKALFAFLIINYDFKFAGDSPTTRPPNINFAGAVIPNPRARLLFRKRSIPSGV